MLRRGGFTLIELLITVAVLAVGATLAAPGAMQMIASRKVQTAAQSIVDGLNKARAEAVRRNSPVQFALRTDGIGWNLTQPSSGETLQSYSSRDWNTLQITSQGAATSVTFLATGVRQAGGTPLSQVTVSSPVGSGPTRIVNVFGGGLIRMCDPGVTAVNDPRRC